MIVYSNFKLFFSVSSNYLSALPGNLFGGVIADFIGYKRFLVILVPLATIFWTLLAYSPTLPILYTSRIILGVIFGVNSVLVSPLISEICEPRVRGFSIVFSELQLGLGVVIGYLMAHICYWRTATLICGLTLIPAILILPFIPQVSIFLHNFVLIFETQFKV